MKKYVIYTKNSCPFCTQAKQLLNGNGATYSAINVGTDITTEDFKTLFPDQRTLPLIYVTEGGLTSPIGGFNELRQHLYTESTLQGMSL